MTPDKKSYHDLKLSVQTAGIKMNDYLEWKIHGMIKKLRKQLPGINWVDIYLKTTGDEARPKTVTVRFGIPGPDVVASDSGSRWKTLLKNIEKRLIRQLGKRKLPLQR